MKNVNISIDSKLVNTLAYFSDSFKSSDEKSISFEKFYKIYGKSNNIGMMELIKLYGLQQSVYKMFVYDYVVCNIDRHGKNTEVIISENNIRLAPLFDNSLTFLTNRPEDEILKIYTTTIA